MSFDEALALQILRKFSTHQLPEHVCSWLSELFHTADSRLAHCISKEEQRYASWSKKVSIISGHFQLQTPPINNEIFHTILNALFRERIDPHPGRAWTVPVADYAVPDVIAYRSGKSWRVRLNGDLVPRLSVNDAYVQALGQEPRGSYEGLQAHVQQARWLIRQVAQRFETLLRVATEIVARQQAFFESGMVALRPMVLREIAEALGLHESTVSRATAGKYMATPHGTLELKRFFSTGVPAADGESASAASIQAMMREMLEQEDPRKPLSDSQLMNKLAERGVELARRTVAKYREGMRVPTASQRKAMALLRMDDG